MANEAHGTGLAMVPPHRLRVLPLPAAIRTSTSCVVEVRPHQFDCGVFFLGFACGPVVVINLLSRPFLLFNIPCKVICAAVIR